MSSSLQTEAQARPPWWRDEKTLKVVLQILFMVGVITAIGILYRNFLVGIERTSYSLGFFFLRNPANFGISEGIPYDPSETYLKAFFVGVVNTIWVSLFGIILATAMGLFLGVARLSSNWLAKRLAAVVTEIFRNIPVLLIIIFWYQAVFLKMPRVRDSITLFDTVYLSNRGINFPSLTPTIWCLPALILAIASIYLVPRWFRSQPQVPTVVTDLSGWAGAVVIFLFFIAVAPPFLVDRPELAGFNFRGGWQFSVEFLALLLGLVTYTGAYIGEVVRGAFLAVPRGQWEASRAIGFSELDTFRLVIVPQALRIMLPSLNTQYLTLIKNSSLAIAAGYADMFNISNTILNQSGRSIEVFAMMMLAYLTMNLGVSYSMNWLNNRVKLVER